MNTFGKLLRIEIFGESHGPAVGVIVDGCPAGIEIAEGDFAADLARRKGGTPGTTARV
ncbi:MAG: chorismate synthase, partial [Candidatus Aminicenantales bacterium]